MNVIGYATMQVWHSWKAVWDRTWSNFFSRNWLLLRKMKSRTNNNWACINRNLGALGLSWSSHGQEQNSYLWSMEGPASSSKMVMTWSSQHHAREKDSLSVLVSAGVKFCHANLIRRKKDPLHSCGVGEFHDKVLFWRVWFNRRSDQPTIWNWCM
jgi:hypothetical protein